MLVAGSSGSYFFKADCIIQMDNYRPVDITEFAKKEAEAFRAAAKEAPPYERPSFARCPKSDRAVWENDRLKIKTMGLDGILINKETIDMRYVEQLVDTEQLGALGYLLKYAELHLFDGKRTVREAVNMLSKLIAEEGMEAVCEGTYLPINLAAPREQEIYACFNRYRGMRL